MQRQRATDDTLLATWQLALSVVLAGTGEAGAFVDFALQGRAVVDQGAKLPNQHTTLREAGAHQAVVARAAKVIGSETGDVEIRVAGEQLGRTGAAEDGVVHAVREADETKVLLDLLCLHVPVGISVAATRARTQEREPCPR